MDAPLSHRLASHLKSLRQSRDWTLEDLADLSTVSRATLSRIEKCEVSPTADALTKLSRAYDMPLSRLLMSVEDGYTAYVGRNKQKYWLDPASGLKRRLISPPTDGLQAEVLECELPAGARLDYSMPPKHGLEHHLIMQEGELVMSVEDETYELRAGDCLRYRLFGASSFQTPPKIGARYVLVLVGG